MHSRTETIGPIRLSYPDLLASIQRVRTLIESANGPPEDGDWVHELLRVKDDVIELKLESDFTIENLRGAPEVASDVWYSFDRRKAPISGVEWRLGDSSRELMVMGTSKEHVDGIVALVLADSIKSRTFFGGARQRLAAGMALAVLGAALSFGGFLPLPSAAQWGFLISGPVISLSVWVLPWISWFPGTAVYAGDASWLVRNAPAISLAGVLLTLVTFLISVVSSVYLTRKP